MLVSVLFLAALCLSFSTTSAQTNLLINGDFEADFQNPSDVPNWEELPTSLNAPQTFVVNFGGVDDSFALFMGSLVTLAGVYQNVTLNPNTQYPLSWSLMVVGDQNRFQVSTVCAGVTTVLFDEGRLNDTQGEFIRRTVTFTTPTGTAPVTCSIRLLAAASPLSNFLLDNVLLTEPENVAGDPVFVGFNSQVYQVHGIPNRIFNIISTANFQLNAMFQFLAQGESMNQGEMRAMRVRVGGANDTQPKLITRSSTNALPITTAWSHEGTYLGSMAMQFKSNGQVIRLKIVPGAYQDGIPSIEIDEKRINHATAALPFALIHTKDVQVTLISRHMIEIITYEIKLIIVNSDRFFNIQSARLSSHIQKDPSLIQGILGQSADATRYFPKYEPSSHASSTEKSDWNEHQIMDYLIADDNLWSGEFTLNQFEISN